MPLELSGCERLICCACEADFPLADVAAFVASWAPVLAWIRAIAGVGRSCSPWSCSEEGMTMTPNRTQPQPPQPPQPPQLTALLSRIWNHAHDALEALADGGTSDGYLGAVLAAIAADAAEALADDVVAVLPC